MNVALPALRHAISTRVRRHAGVVAIACGTYIIGAMSFGCSKPQPPKKAPPVPVNIAVARRMAVPYTIEANGLVMPTQTATVAPQVSGLITRVAFREGDQVTKGQILFQIDPRPYAAAYQQALATLRRDQATAEYAASEVKRYEQLVAKDFVTQDQTDQIRANAAAAQALVEADRAAVADAKFNLDNTTIRAPISGKTGSLLVREGNLVSPTAATPLVVVNQIQPILVRFSVPAAGLALIRQYGTDGGLPITATSGLSPAQVTDTAIGGPPSTGGYSVSNNVAVLPGYNSPGSETVRTSTGTLAFIDNAVDTTTGTITLKGLFPNTDQALWVGQFVAVAMQLYVEENALTVPSAAITMGQQGPFLYVIDSAGVAHQRLVSIARMAGRIAVLASGVQPGERVVTEGQSRLTQGTTVTIRPAGPPAQQRPASTPATPSPPARRP